MTDYRDTVLIAGIGRSGTTWLGDLINYDKRFQTLFEPLHPENGVDLRHKLYNGLYLRPDTCDDTLKSEVRALLTGQRRNAYVDQYNEGDEGSRFLIKEIRLGLTLKWLYTQFPAMPIIYIMRHPGAVVSSQLRLGWKFQSRIFQRMLSQPHLIEDYLSPFTGVMRAAHTEFEMSVLYWCVIHYVLFKQFHPDQIHWVFYENLASDPLNELKKIFTYLKLPLHEEAINPIINRPSKTTWKLESASGWQATFSDRQVKFMLDALQMFGLAQVYHLAETPNTNVAFSLLNNPQYPVYDSRLLLQFQMMSRLKQVWRNFRGWKR